MRKLLLITAVLFSLGSMAQRPLDFTKNIRTFNKNLKLNSLMSQMPTSHTSQNQRRHKPKLRQKHPKVSLTHITSTSTINAMVWAYFLKFTKQSISYSVLKTRFIYRT